ncbi:hypothetical protein [Mammaliicoccus sciuri]|uniref:hypothetical protein n=2 Tax=Mammaliicoccus TaxID=2803850 RepID=UPI0021D0C586|nr:hypothetical protein [Mammaliicoccus sciuri]UXU70198.1 hypothetical protein MUA36_05815 [Mammaliicoccus sciuri]WQL34319.1 hypothetical protein P3U41_05980 [Mammaliicoccus sciuri]WQL61258.1 hypothetical protein P3T96_05980 [Mammaliicoccus sciuri]
MKSITVDVERWIYERESAYPMIKTIECGIGESSLGKYFRYEPVVKVKGVYVPVKNNDTLKIDSQGKVVDIV